MSKMMLGGPFTGNVMIGDLSLHRDYCCPRCKTPCQPKSWEMNYNDAWRAVEFGQVEYYRDGSGTATMVMYCDTCPFENEFTVPLDCVTYVIDAPTTSKEYYIMAINSVTYGRVEGGETVEVNVCLEGQSPEDGLLEAKRFVNKQLGLGPSEDELAQARQLLEEAGEL